MSVASDNQTQLVIELVEAAVRIHPERYPNLLVDALAYVIVLDEQDLDRAIERLKASYSTIATAHAVVTQGAGRA